MARRVDRVGSHRQAVGRARDYDATRPRAVAVEYRRRDKRVYVELSTGGLFAFPVDDLERVSGAPEEAIAMVTITPSGHGLRWRALDADFLLDELIQGVTGTRAWMREIGRRGGRARTERKAAAARMNGTKGGRPRRASARRNRS